MSFRFFVVFAVLCIFSAVAHFVNARSVDYLRKVERIAIRAHPIVFKPSAPKQKQFGKLIWRGGLFLASKSKSFGGISGLRLDEKGEKLLAITDKGAWIRADIIYKNNRPAGLKNSLMGPLNTTKNVPLKKSRLRDSESLAFYKNDLLIGFERQHRIDVYEYMKGRPGRKLRQIKLPKAVGNFKRNKGFEAVDVIRFGKLKGQILAFAERFQTKAGYLTGWILKGGKAKPIYILQKKGFEVTDLVCLEDGGALVLERFYRASEGVKFRLRYFRADKIKPGALLAGEILLDVGNDHSIDNMEAIDVHKDPKGKIVITLMSDDNFNFFQRTLLMQFEWNR